MEIREKIAMTRDNIWQALKDYGAHSRQTEVLDDVSSAFVDRLAEDSVYAKQGLREMFRKSPVWDEDLDALVINGTRTHNPDYNLIYNLGYDILRPAMNIDDDRDTKIMSALRFFARPQENPTEYIAAIKALAPKAYTPTKKLSRVFKAICDALGVSNDIAGGEFQRLYAQFADELSSKKINFKLFVSLNPAHFISMSNPKNDRRGSMMTSCHSFDSTEYEWNNGCSGYARDNCTIIAFTAANPAEPETLNNRKTTRQLFMYRPGNGLLLQSRMYNTSGGTTGAQAESKVYRDLIQREISACEDVPNLWRTFRYYDNNEGIRFEAGDGFGGYQDWTYEEFAAMVSIRNDHATDYKPFYIGTWGLCIECGDEINEKLYCDDCRNGGHDDEYCCDDCGDYCEETFTVHDSHGDSIEVCENCRDNHYRYCENCEEYYPDDEVCHTGDDECLCDNCRSELCACCDDCGDNYRVDDMYEAVDSYGNDVLICENCRDNDYVECDECGETYHQNDMTEGPCPDCYENRELDNIKENEKEANVA